jgi:crossover junction endodeoxyribonuclease RuvC
MGLVSETSFGLDTGEGLGVPALRLITTCGGRRALARLEVRCFPGAKGEAPGAPTMMGILMKDACRARGATAAVNLGPMRVFGIDCGTEITGFGVVESDDSGRERRLVMKRMGTVRLVKSKTTAERLEQVFRELSAELTEWKPDAVAIEEVFYSVNAKSALKLGQVRGVALLAAATLQLPVAEYAPLKIKSSVVGYGLAKKEQVQFMVARLLELSAIPEPADAADALAIAICHIHTAQTLAAQGVAR